MTLMGAKLNTKVLQKWLFELNKGHFGIEFPNVSHIHRCAWDETDPYSFPYLSHFISVNYVILEQSG